MQEETAPESSGSEQASGGSETNQPKSDAYPKHFVDKLMGEKKKAMSELEELRKKVETFESKELESKGKQGELIEALRKQVAERDQKLNQTLQKFAERSVFSAIKEEAIKQGCVDPDALIKLADLSQLEVDRDTFEVNREDLQRVIQEMATQKQYLFKRQAAAPKDAVPAVNKESFNGKQDLKNLPLSEKIRLMAEMSANRTFAKNSPKTK